MILKNISPSICNHLYFGRNEKNFSFKFGIKTKTDIEEMSVF